MGQHKTAIAVISALVVVGVGFSVWASTNLLPYPANAIPAPHLPPFSRCQPPMWLQTQSRLAERLGDCPGQLYSPPFTMKLAEGTVFAIGCFPHACARLSNLYSSAPTVVEAQGQHGGAYYFKAVGVGRATMWASFSNPANCSTPRSGSPPPDRCPAIALAVTQAS
jgi:hypothetical protein